MTLRLTKGQGHKVKGQSQTYFYKKKKDSLINQQDRSGNVKIFNH